MPETKRNETRPPWSTPFQRVQRRVERLMEGSSGAWLQQIARLGYLTRGAIFMLVGLLALQAAAGMGSRPAGPRKAIWLIGQSSFIGELLLWLTSIGTGGYTLWRILQTILDPARTEEEGIGQRVVRQMAFLGSGIFYGTLTLTTIQLATGGVLHNGDQTRRAWTAWALALPFGAWAVGLVGAVLAGAGLHAGYRAYRATFMRLYGNRIADFPKPRQHLIRWVGRLGLSMLGLTLIMIGSFVVEAAWFSDPDSVVGIGGALGALLTDAHGPWLLGAAGIGFVAYGLHCMVLGRHRELIESNIPD